MNEALRQDAWRALKDHFEVLDGRLEVPAAQSAVMKLNIRTEKFPFYAYMSIPLTTKTDDHESIDLVVSFSCHARGLRMTSDVSFDSGEMIAEGPQAHADPRRPVDAWVLEVIDQAGAFFLSLQGRLNDLVAT